MGENEDIIEKQAQHIDELKLHKMRMEHNMQKVAKEQRIKLKTMKKQIYFEQKERNIQQRLQSHQSYYHKMNQFILNITQSQFKLPRNVLNIICKAQKELILHHHKFEKDIKTMQAMLRQQRAGNVLLLHYSVSATSASDNGSYKAS